MKQCTRCGQWKDESQFNWRRQDKNMYQSVCRDCQHDQSKDHYERNSDSVKAKAAETKHKAIEEAQRYLYEVLSYSTCANCGEYDFSVLTFHHVRGSKRMDVSAMASQGYSIETIKAEIAKCEVLCASCHMRAENDKKGGRFKRFWPKWPWEE